MRNSFFEDKARIDFNKARLRDTFSKLINLLTPDKYSLLSFKFVKKILKPHAQTYKGIQAIPISLIVGSEGRYRDFNKAFLPRHDYLRVRWENIDKAHLNDIILPAVQLYEIGGVYFVIDGNHRVSVAKSQGMEQIDAEVTRLDTKISLSPEMTKQDLLKEVVLYERKKFFKETHLQDIINEEELLFTETGRYEDIKIHIECHKYYLNENKSEEISYKDAAISWYNTLFKPITEAIIEEKIISRFPGRTSADLYVWIIRHWDELKKKYGQHYSIKDAVKHFSETFGQSLWQQIKDFFKKLMDVVLKK
jgi:hypothetical protein